MIRPTSPVAVLFATLIVSAGADVVAVDRASGPRLTVVRAKLTANDRQSWLSAIASDSVGELSKLLNRSNASQLVAITASNGKSALMVACKRGDLALAQRLLDVGADVHQSTQTLGTPFMFAVLGGHHSMAQWLIEQGADMHATGSNGWTALTIAAAKGDVTLLQWLINEGADAQVRDVYRYTPLIRAVDNGFEQAASLLLSLPDTDVHARDEYDNTALHHAVFANNDSMVALLLEYNADPTLRNRDGLSALDIANSLTIRSDELLHQLHERIRRGL